MDFANVERDFTGWVATQLNKTVDSTIFRGGLPEGYDNVLGVVFGAKLQTRSFYGFRPHAWNVQIIGKYTDRDTANQVVATISNLFPIQDFSHGGTKFISAYPTAASNEPYEDDDNGKVKHFISYNLAVTVLTSEPVIVTGNTNNQTIGAK